MQDISYSPICAVRPLKEKVKVQRSKGAEMEVVAIRVIQQWRGRENFFVGGTHTKRKRENRKNEEDSKQR